MRLGHNVILSAPAILAILAAAALAVWINTRPPQVDWHEAKGDQDCLYAERGWPFRYLEVDQYVRKGQAEPSIRDGWPRNSGLPAVNYRGKLVANFAVIILFTCGLLYGALRGARKLCYFRLDGLTAVDEPTPPSPVLRARLIPTLLLMLPGVAGLILASAAVVHVVGHCADTFLTNYSFERVFTRANFFELYESALAITASVLLLVASKTCWKSAIVHTCVCLTAAIVIVFILFLVLRVDDYTEWGYYFSRMFARF